MTTLPEATYDRLDALGNSGGRRPLARRRLHILDACLTRLEDANQLGEQLVTGDIVATFGAYVPGLVPFMGVHSALELVFAEQEKWISSRCGRPRRPGLTVVAELSDTDVDAMTAEPFGSDEARKLTDQIKAGFRDTCLLVHKAHQARAWALLGYRSWESYVQREFGFSRSRSYELLDQARVLLGIQSAIGMSGMPDISARKAARIKPHLAEVVEALGAAKAASPEAAMAVVRRILRSHRPPLQARLSESPGKLRTVTALRSTPMVTDLEIRSDSSPALRLKAVLAFLADLPDPGEFVAQMRADDLPVTSELESAVEWLNDFAAMYRRATLTGGPPLCSGVERPGADCVEMPSRSRLGEWTTRKQTRQDRVRQIAAECQTSRGAAPRSRHMAATNTPRSRLHGAGMTMHETRSGKQRLTLMQQKSSLELHPDDNK